MGVVEVLVLPQHDHQVPQILHHGPVQQLAPVQSAAPDRLWVADFTYVPAWTGTVYVAFVIDAYSRRILGWRAARSMKTTLVHDALEQALWTRRRDGDRDLAGLLHHTDAGSQYTSIAFTERLAAGVSGSVGTVGDAYDNANPGGTGACMASSSSSAT